MLLFELMQLATQLNEVGLNPKFKFELHMWLFKYHSFDLSYTVALSCYNMRENGTDG